METKDNYDVQAECDNCDYGHQKGGAMTWVEKGNTVEQTDCPKCGLKTLKKYW